MEYSSESIFCYEKAFKLLKKNDYRTSLIYIKNNIQLFCNNQDKSLAYIICGFLQCKLKDFLSSIEDFSKAISYEEKVEFLSDRSKDIPFNARSNSRYQIGDFKGAIEDKRISRKIRLIDEVRFLKLNNSSLDFKNLSLGLLSDQYYDTKYKILIKLTKSKKSKYDLINDYKKVIDKERINDIINKLEDISDKKYMEGDFKSSIRALRRSEKYY